VDVLVLDEAQELGEDALAALLPTISASANPQTIFTGTPPGPNADGAIFSRIRTDGLAGSDPRLCWHEWSCEPGVDLDDPASWAQSNPALGSRLDPTTVADERAVMDDATFARERLGSWAEATVHRVISQQSWQACSDPGIVMDSQQPIALALDVSPDRTHTSIAVAGWTMDGNPFVDVIDSRGGEPEWSIARLVDLNSRHNPRAIVVDAVSAASSLIDALRQAGLTITVTSARDMAAACGQFYDSVVSGQLRHLEQPALNSALALARRRRIGDGGWAWSRKDSDVDITPLTTATLALFGLTSSEVAEKPRTRSGKATFA
jgi:phage terminase large subunit-like protein